MTLYLKINAYLSPALHDLGLWVKAVNHTIYFRWRGLLYMCRPVTLCVSAYTSAAVRGLYRLSWPNLNGEWVKRLQPQRRVKRRGSCLQERLIFRHEHWFIRPLRAVTRPTYLISFPQRHPSGQRLTGASKGHQPPTSRTYSVCLRMDLCAHMYCDVSGEKFGSYIFSMGSSEEPVKAFIND